MGLCWDFTVPPNFEIVFPQLDLFAVGFIWNLCICQKVSMIFQKKVGVIGLILIFVSLCNLKILLVYQKFCRFCSFLNPSNMS